MYFDKGLRGAVPSELVDAFTDQCLTIRKNAAIACDDLAHRPIQTITVQNRRGENVLIPSHFAETITDYARVTTTVAVDTTSVTRKRGCYSRPPLPMDVPQLYNMEAFIASLTHAPKTVEKLRHATRNQPVYLARNCICPSILQICDAVKQSIEHRKQEACRNWGTGILDHVRSENDFRRLPVPMLKGTQIIKNMYKFKEAWVRAMRRPGSSSQMGEAFMTTIPQDMLFDHFTGATANIAYMQDNYVDWEKVMSTFGWNDIDPIAFAITSRQFGKTTICALFAACFLLAHEGKKVLVFSTGARISENFVDEVRKSLMMILTETGLLSIYRVDPTKQTIIVRKRINSFDTNIVNLMKGLPSTTTISICCCFRRNVLAVFVLCIMVNGYTMINYTSASRQT